MYDQFDFTVQQGDLNRIVYRFTNMNNRVLLNEYSDETRETKRHKFRVGFHWSRISGGYRKGGRELPAKPHVPDEVKEAALSGMRDYLFYAENLEDRNPNEHIS